MPFENNEQEIFNYWWRFFSIFAQLLCSCVDPKICHNFIFTLLFSLILSLNLNPDYIWFFFTHSSFNFEFLLFLFYFYFVFFFTINKHFFPFIFFFFFLSPLSSYSPPTTLPTTHTLTSQDNPLCLFSFEPPFFSFHFFPHFFFLLFFFSTLPLPAHTTWPIFSSLFPLLSYLPLISPFFFLFISFPSFYLFFYFLKTHQPSPSPVGPPTNCRQQATVNWRLSFPLSHSSISLTFSLFLTLPILFYFIFSFISLHFFILSFPTISTVTLSSFQRFEIV